MENTEKSFVRELLEETEVKTSLKRLIVSATELCNKVCAVASKELEVREEKLIVEKRNVIKNSELPSKESLEIDMEMQRSRFAREDHDKELERTVNKEKRDQEMHEINVRRDQRDQEKWQAE